MNCRHIRRNPDEELRRLERIAAHGDPAALDLLHHYKTRSALPTHYHFCDGCIFLWSQPITEEPPVRNVEELGCNYHYYDFYYCPSSNTLGGSLIARFGCEISSYSSTPVDVYLSHPEIQHGIRKQIYDLAQARDLIS